MVEAEGEPFSILNTPLLESACAAPRNKHLYDYEDDVVALATTLLFSIARNHPFAQGNKRTAFLCAIMFLEQNGYTLLIADTEFLGKMIVLVIERKLTEDDFIELLQPYVRPVTDAEP